MSKSGTIAAMLMAMNMENDIFNEMSIKKPNTPLKDKLPNLKTKNNNKYGIKKYYYGDNYVEARNQKNADRKARNKGYIK